MIIFRKNVEFLKEIIESKNSKKFYSKIIKDSVFRAISDMILPDQIRRLVDIHNKFDFKNNQTKNLSFILSQSILSNLNLDDFDYIYDSLFKNWESFKKVDLLRTIVLDFCKEKYKCRFQICFLNILESIGIYSFLCQNHWSNKLKRIFNKESTFVLKQEATDDKGEMFALLNNKIKLLKKKEILFFVTPHFKSNFFEDFENIFNQNKKINKIFLNSKNQNYLRFIADPNFEKEKKDKIRKRICSRINKSIKSCIDFMKQNLKNPISKFEIVLLMRDFAFSHCYTSKGFLKAKQMILDSKINKKHFNIPDQNPFINLETTGNEDINNKIFISLFSDIRHFMIENNEPSGLAFLSLLISKMLFSKNGNQLRLITTKIMFSVLFNKSNLTILLKTIDSLNVSSLIFKRLVEFVLEWGMTIEDLFVKNGIEHLFISFVLIQFEFIIKEMSLEQLFYFLQNMRALLKVYIEKSHKNEYFLKKYWTNEQDKREEWIEESSLFSILKENDTYSEIIQTFTIWEILIECVLTLGIFFFL